MQIQKYSIVSVLLLTLTILGTGSQILAQQSLAVTIYNDQFAMVKDTRTIKFDKGESTLYFTDVSSTIQTETVTFKALKNPTSIRVYEQNFQNNLINKENILKKYIEKKVDIVAELGDQVRRFSGILLAQDGAYVLKTDTGIVSLNRIAGIELPAVPQGFFTVPTLNWKVFSEVAQASSCEVAYRTTGFGWAADYSIILNNDETKGDIGGWVTIDNNSGKKYVNAKLKLIAGEVNVVQPPQPEPMPMMFEMMAFKADGAAGGAAPPVFEQKSFADYHLYTLSAPVTLNESSQKQVEFIPKVFNVPLRKYNLITVSTGGYSQSNIAAQSRIQFNNTQEKGLGMPLPKGTVRIFKQDDADNSLEFVGEDSIKHTPKNQNITLNMGNAFDIITNLVASSRTQFGSNGGYRADLNLTITNHKEIPAQIEVQLNTSGDNLKISWKEGNRAALVKDSASLSKIKFTIKGGESVSFLWTEDYQV